MRSVGDVLGRQLAGVVLADVGAAIVAALPQGAVVALAPGEDRGRAEGGPDRRQEVGPITGDDDLGGAAGDEVDGGQPVAEGGGVLDGQCADEADDRLAVLAVALVAGEGGQAQQADRGEAVGARGRVVHQVLGAGDEGLGVVPGREHPAEVRVPEEVEEGVGRGAGLGDPPGLAGGLGQAGEGVDERAVVGGVGEVPRAGLGLPRRAASDRRRAAGWRAGTPRSPPRRRPTPCSPVAAPASASAATR